VKGLCRKNFWGQGSRLVGLGKVCVGKIFWARLANQTAWQNEGKKITPTPEGVRAILD
jgi:hypothetical protein